MSTGRQTKSIWRGRIFPTVEQWSLCFLCAVYAGSVRAAEPAVFHFAFSSSVLTDVNENDAKASIKVWAQSIATQQGVAIYPDVLVTPDVETMNQALRAGKVDAAVLTLDDYASVSRDVAFSHLFCAVHGGKLTEEYVLLVHRASVIEQLAQLRGHELLVFKNPRAGLAEPWLDIQLMGSGQPAATAFFSRIERVPKLSKVVLPVFFRQADACLVTRRGFETMCELNPQIGRQLRVIAGSPAFVPAMFCIRADIQPTTADPVVANVRALHTTPAGLQILTIFEGERLEEISPARLAESLNLLAEHARLAAAAEAVVARAAAGDSQPKGGSN